jgi:hypothetical protein
MTGHDRDYVFHFYTPHLSDRHPSGLRKPSTMTEIPENSHLAQEWQQLRIEATEVNTILA